MRKRRDKEEPLVFSCSSLPFTKLNYSDLIFRKSVEFIEGFFSCSCFNRKRLDDGRARNSPTEKKQSSNIRSKRGEKANHRQGSLQQVSCINYWLVWMRTFSNSKCHMTKDTWAVLRWRGSSQLQSWEPQPGGAHTGRYQHRSTEGKWKNCLQKKSWAKI